MTVFVIRRLAQSLLGKAGTHCVRPRRATDGRRRGPVGEIACVHDRTWRLRLRFLIGRAFEAATAALPGPEDSSATRQAGLGPDALEVIVRGERWRPVG
jgi:hypothetical protein